MKKQNLSEDITEPELSRWWQTSLVILTERSIRLNFFEQFMCFMFSKRNRKAE